MRNPTPTDFALLTYVRALVSDMIIPLTHEGMMMESMIRLIALEERLDADHTAFLIVLALGNVTEDNWESSIVPF